ncbi:hypothetical protein ASJ33_05275 [Dehalococcoides mccartyi]|uniref:hypothetical protein n=1 Tax=Dehalococcoides mccartyi TaxID=61435 RepID=UPI0006BD2612|nr:hypothetical protein [Dehalococcoides mccartyi]APH12605.1 hypothetical protein ASJ33_05275 [Dehalococcoides mccartyi]BAS31158.1 hypothetical protein IBK_0083 [Dehalococcoides mccartyi IBARAKI]
MAIKPQPIQLDITYSGPAVSDGQMDVRELAVSMLGVGSLFDSANQVLNGSASKINVNVKATAPGSFHILYEIIGPITSSLPMGDIISSAEALKNLLFGSGTGILGLFALIKWLNNRKPKIEKINDGLYRLTIDNQSYEVPLELLNLYQNALVRRAMSDVTRPVREQGIDRIDIRTNQELLQSATKEDINAFEIPELLDDPILKETRKINFSIISLAFKENNKWRLSDGDAIFNVTMNDANFLSKVDNNLISFSKGDILYCELLTTQWQVQNGVKTEYEVIKVLKHTPARQLPLLDIN